MSGEKRWSEDDLGVISWGGRKTSSGAYNASGHDPFSVMLEIMMGSSSVPEHDRHAAILVHDDLDVARSISLSLFGKNWREHVMEIYDRFIARQKEEREAAGRDL